MTKPLTRGDIDRIKEMHVGVTLTHPCCEEIAPLIAELERLQAQRGDLLAALERLEAVSRSHCREGEPGYDRGDVLAYCDEAADVIAAVEGEPS